MADRWQACGSGGDVETVGRWNRSPVERCQSLEILLVAQIPTSQRATPSAQVKVKKGTIGEDPCNFMDGAVAGPGSESYKIAIIGYRGAQT